MKRTILFLGFIASLTWSIQNVQAGAWVQKPGNYYVKFSLNYFSTKDQFSFTGQRQPLNAQSTGLRDSEFGDTNFSVYGEVGVLDWLTAVFSTSYKNYSSSGFNLSDQLNFDNSVSGLSDIFIGGRIRLTSQPFVLALQPMIKLPTGDKDAIIPLGTGSADTELRMQFGTKLPLPLANYFTADLGFTGRGGSGFNNEIPYLIELGVYPMKRLIVKGAVDGRKSTQSLTSQAGINGGSSQNMLIVDQDFTRVWGGLIYSASPAVDLSFEYSRVVGGKNTLAGNTFYLGLAIKSP